jgi:hypothetical protein
VDLTPRGSARYPAHHSFSWQLAADLIARADRAQLLKKGCVCCVSDLPRYGYATAYLSAPDHGSDDGVFGRAGAPGAGTIKLGPHRAL